MAVTDRRSMSTSNKSETCASGKPTDTVIVGYPWLSSDHEKILAAANRRGMTTALWQPDQLELVVERGCVLATVNGRPVAADIIIPRGVNRVFPFVSQWLAVLEQSGATVVNDLDSTAVCLDKMRTTFILSKSGVPILSTTSSLLAGRTPQVNEPVVVKPAFGSGGAGVRSFGDTDALRSAFMPPPARDALVPLYQHYVVQPLATGAGLDYRVVVANGRAIAATTRRATAGTFVTNGPCSQVVAGAPEQVRELGETAAKALALDFAGVDIIEHRGSFHVLEVNCWPGLTLTSAVCEIDLAEALLDAAQAKRSKSHRASQLNGNINGR